VFARVMNCYPTPTHYTYPSHAAAWMKEKSRQLGEGTLFCRAADDGFCNMTRRHQGRREGGGSTKKSEFFKQWTYSRTKSTPITCSRKLFKKPMNHAICCRKKERKQLRRKWKQLSGNRFAPQLPPLQRLPFPDPDL
jgi:hypothetical protein